MVSGIRNQVQVSGIRSVYQQPDLEFWRIYQVSDDADMFADVVTHVLTVRLEP
jgi:hypothetical protein